MFIELVYGRSFLGFIHTFDLSGERNIPTWYASGSLLLCAVLSFLVAHTHRKAGSKWTKYWFGLAWLFIYLSIDETATVHERIGAALDRISPTLAAVGGILNYLWVLFGLAAVLIVSLLYLRFFVALPRRTRTLFFIASATFVGGALGVEMVNAWIADTYGGRTVQWVTLTIVEELLEMTGVLIFVYALLEIITKQAHSIRVELRQ